MSCTRDRATAHPSPRIPSAAQASSVSVSAAMAAVWNAMARFSAAHSAVSAAAGAARASGIRKRRGRMVKGIAEVRARFKAVPARVRDEVKAEVERQAGRIVAQMRQLQPYSTIRIGWTWGDAPAGSLVLARSSAGTDFGRVAATIYAIGPLLRDSRVPVTLAEVAEHGTRARRQRTTGRSTGRMPATPYFYPVYRANRRGMRAAISRAVTRAVKQS